MRTLLLLAAFGLVGWSMARTIHKRASRSPAMKSRMIILAIVGALFARPAADDSTKLPSL